MSNHTLKVVWNTVSTWVPTILIAVFLVGLLIGVNAPM